MLPMVMLSSMSPSLHHPPLNGYARAMLIEIHFQAGQEVFHNIQ
jgi:hypothetical protein